MYVSFSNARALSLALAHHFAMRSDIWARKTTEWQPRECPRRTLGICNWEIISKITVTLCNSGVAIMYHILNMRKYSNIIKWRSEWNTCNLHQISRLKGLGAFLQIFTLAVIFGVDSEFPLKTCSNILQNARNVRKNDENYGRILPARPERTKFTERGISSSQSLASLRKACTESQATQEASPSHWVQISFRFGDVLIRCSALSWVSLFFTEW